VFFYKQRRILGEFGRERLINLGMTLLINIVIGLSPGSGIDNWGHLGGALGGLILAWFLCPSYTLVTAQMNAFNPAMLPPGALPPDVRLVDSNPLPKQSLAVGLFAFGLVALTIIARMLQH
jgi:hypothetical protein